MRVRPLRRDEAREAVALAAEAFADDPLYRHLHPDPARRRRGFEVEYRAALRHVFFPTGRVDAVDADGSLAGVALWLPDGGRVPWWREFRMWPAMVRAVGPGGLAVALEAFAALDAAAPTAPHHHLGVLAVDPMRHGRGLGTALLRAGLDRADQSGVGCYLQAGTPRAVRYYERHGFRTTAALPVPDGPTYRGMWRPAGGR